MSTLYDSFFPTKQDQTKWSVQKEEGKLHLSNDKHVFSFTFPGFSNNRVRVQKLDSKPIADFKETNTAQVHHSNPGEIYMTLHDGKKNPTFRIKHKYEDDWEIIPKGKEPNKLLDMLLDKEAASKGCLMADVNHNDAQDILNWSRWHIDKDKLSDDGFEKKPHTTVMYGFNRKFQPKEFNQLEDWPKDSLDIELGKIKRFKANPNRPESDVLVVEVKSDRLVNLNNKLNDVHGKKINNYYKDYNPHLTLAYVKPGTLTNLDGHAFFEGKKLKIDKLTYSSARHKKTEWKLSQKKAEDKPSLSEVKIHVSNDPYLSTAQKSVILSKLKDDTTFDNIMEGARGAVMAHSISSFLDLDKKTQTLLSLAGFGIGVAFNTLFEKETNGPTLRAEGNIIRKLR